MGFKLHHTSPFLIRKQSKLDEFRKRVPLSKHTYDMRKPAYRVIYPTHE